MPALFKTENRALVEQELKNFEAANHIRWINAGGREQFIIHLTRHSHVVNGKLENTMYGHGIKNVNDYFKEELKRNGFTLNKDVVYDYKSPFSKRSPEKAAQHAAAMKEIVKRQIDNGRLEFKYEGAKNQFIDLIAKNFLVSDTEKGPRFFRLHDDAILSTKSWDLQELINTLGISHLVDQERTRLTQQAYKADLKEKAIRLLGTNNADRVLSKMDELEKIDNIDTTKRVIDKSMLPSEADLSKHFYQIGLMQTYKLEHELLLSEMSQLNQWAGKQVNAVNSIESIAKEVSQIVPEPAPQAWEF